MCGFVKPQGARGLGDAGKDRGPLPVRALPEEPHGRVPGRILALGEPAPFRHAAQRQKNRPSQRPGEVRRHGVDAHHQVEIGHQRCGVEQRLGAEVGLVEHAFDARTEGDLADLRAARLLLQRDQPHAGNVGEGGKG